MPCIDCPSAAIATRPAPEISGGEARRPGVLTVLTRAAGKKAGSLLRVLHGTPTYPQWQSRAEMCARCPISVSVRGHLYCGRPLLQQLHREAHQGCGCPATAKAKDPAEHCPVDRRLTAAETTSAGCNCKWCAGNS